jgi:hypothetical protein
VIRAAWMASFKSHKTPSVTRSGGGAVLKVEELEFAQSREEHAPISRYGLSLLETIEHVILRFFAFETITLVL